MERIGEEKGKAERERENICPRDKIKYVKSNRGLDKNDDDDDNYLSTFFLSIKQSTYRSGTAIFLIAYY